MEPSLAAGDAAHHPMTVDILLVDDDEQWARVTARLLESVDEAFQVELAHSLTAGRQRFEATDPDCVICDYQLGDGTGIDLLETVRQAEANCPFVLVTGRGDETVASEAIGQGVTDYIPKNNDDTDGTLLANRVRNAVEAATARRQLDRERRGKAATLDLLTSTTSMNELFEQFCRVLVADHGYSGAWIGGVEDTPDGEVVPQAVAGCEAYLDAIAVDGVVSVDGLDPVVAAVAQNEPVFASVAEADHTDSRALKGVTTGWKRTADEHGIATAAGVPITHDGIQAGVCCVYRSVDKPPLDDSEWELLTEYAQIIGYIHRTAELKQSLLSDNTVRVDIELTDPAAPLVELTTQLDPAVTVRVLSTIERADGTTLSLARLSGVDPSELRRAVDACKSVEINNVRSDGDELRCDLQTTVQTPEAMLAAHGAEIERTVSSNGSLTVSIAATDHSVVSSFTDALRSQYDGVTVTTLWSHDDKLNQTESSTPLTSLTEKQLNVLSYAYFDGYFEQPRGMSATELAEKFDISRPTMTQHLRAAQRKVFSELLEQD